MAELNSSHLSFLSCCNCAVADESTALFSNLQLQAKNENTGFLQLNTCCAIRKFVRSYLLYSYVRIVFGFAYHIFHIFLFFTLVMTPLIARSFFSCSERDMSGLLTADDEDGTRIMSVWSSGISRLMFTETRDSSKPFQYINNTSGILARGTTGVFFHLWELSPVLLLACYLFYIFASFLIFFFVTNFRLTGHFSLLQLVVGGMELVWYMQHGSSFAVLLWLASISSLLPYPLVPFAKQRLDGKVTFHAFSKSRVRIWQMELSPEKYFFPVASTLESLNFYVTTAFIVIFIGSFVLNFQRVLNAIVGVRELAVTVGHRRCPLCGEEWELSAEYEKYKEEKVAWGKSSSVAERICITLTFFFILSRMGKFHRCPNVALDRNLVDDAVGTQSNSPIDHCYIYNREGMHEKADFSKNIWAVGNSTLPLSYGTLKSLEPNDGHKTGDTSTKGCHNLRPRSTFPSLEDAGWISWATYGWLNPLMRFGIIDIEVLRHERFLPSLPRDLTSLQNIAKPAWQRWVSCRQSVGTGWRFLQDTYAGEEAEGAEDESGVSNSDGDCGYNDLNAKIHESVGQSDPLTSTSLRLKGLRMLSYLLKKMFFFITTSLLFVLCKALMYVFACAVGDGAYLEVDERKEGIAGVESHSAITGAAAKSYSKSVKHDVRLFTLFFKHISGRRFVFFCVPLRLASDLLSLAVPIIIYHLILAMEEGSSKGVGSALGVCGVLFFVLLGRAVFLQEYMSQLYRSALEASTAIKAMVLEKTLALPLAQRTFTDSEVIHLVTVDALRCSKTLMHLHHSWWCPCFGAASLYVLHMHIGTIPTITALSIILLALPFQKAAGGRVQKAQQRCAACTANSVELVDEAVTSMRQVKAMGAENAYLNSFKAARQEETKNEFAAVEAMTNSACLTEAINVLLTSACYTAYYFLGGSLSVRFVVPALVALNLVRNTIKEWPVFVAAIPHGYASLRRIEAFLQRTPDEFLSTCVDSAKATLKMPGAVVCGGCSFTWQVENTCEAAQRPMLRDVRMLIKPGELVVVQGPVGSGKSTLLLAMLGEVNRCRTTPKERPVTAASADDTNLPFGRQLKKKDLTSMSLAASAMECDKLGDFLQHTDGFCIFGRVAYCPETPWLQHDTIRANIILNSAYDRSWYRTVTRACGLNEDFLLLAKGDASLVGGEGVQLSAGQRARVALARALYSCADIYIFDNVLVFLDARLQKHIIERVFCGILRNRTVILTTYVIPPALEPDRFFTLCSDGTIEEKEIQQLSHLAAAEFEKASMNKELLVDDKGIDEDYSGADGHVTCRKADHVLEYSNACQTSLYFRCFFSVLGFGLVWVLLSSVAQHLLQVGRDIWLGIWIAKRPISSTGFLLSYFLIGVFATLCIIPRVRIFFYVVRGAINSIYFAAIERMFRAPASYFDVNAGRILAGVFFSDQEAVDHSLAESLDAIVTGVLQTLAIVAFNAMVNSWFLLVIPLTVMLFYRVVELYLIVTGQVRRLENRSVRGPVSILREVLEGAPVVRCMGLNDIIREEYCKAMDVTNTAGMISHMADCWVNLRLEIITVLMTTTAALLGVFFASYIMSPAFAAVAVVCCLQTSNILLLLCRSVSAFQLRFVRVEQLLELQQAPEEPLITLPTTQEKRAELDPSLVPVTVCGRGSPGHFAAAQVSVMKPGAAHARKPVLELVNVSAKYSEHSPYVLRNVSFAIYEKERVGIVGSSGHGKSTFFSVLLRLVDVIEGGGVYLRGVSAGLVPYPELRRQFMLVLQNPLVMRGTWRLNLLVGSGADVPDAAVWAALHAVGLDSLAARSGGLDGMLLRGAEREGGVRLTPGQRQLLWLARAVLCRPQFFLFDELPDMGATETRNVLQRLLANELRDCTALLVAHSVRTLEALCTRVVVMENDSISQTLEIGSEKYDDVIKRKL